MTGANRSEETIAMSVAVVREMFEQMVVGKDGTAIERYYDPSFVMYSNGMTQNFDEFSASHLNIYDTPISYAIEYDEEAWVEAEDKVAGRRREPSAPLPPMTG